MMTLTAKPSFTVVDDYVTEGVLQKLFGKSSITLELWRKNKGLPFVVIPGDGRPAIRFVLADVLAWAKANSVPTFKVAGAKKGR